MTYDHMAAHFDKAARKATIQARRRTLLLTLAGALVFALLGHLHSQFGFPAPVVASSSTITR